MTRPTRVLLMLGIAACLAFSTACGDKEDSCGNGTIEAGESCDGSDLGAATCQTLGFTSGTLGCTSGCLFDVSACEGLVSCGNGVVDEFEQCDGTDLNGETCTSRLLGGGELSCDPITCQFDVSGCEGGGICGDGVADGVEECDGLDLRGLDCHTLDASYLGGRLDCSPSCTLRTSGCYLEPDFPIGGPCETDDDCPGGLCMPEVGSTRMVGAPGGMCFEPCAEDGSCPLSGEAALCVSQGHGPSYCYRKCDPQAADCRSGYECIAVGSDAVCYPHCTEDEQCVITQTCDTDPESFSEGLCITPDEVCTGGVDEDFDGMTDCSDPDCNADMSCPSGEDCYNGMDDDGDGLTDCDDGECVNYGICTGVLCSPAAGALLECGTVLTGENNAATGSTTVISRYTCVGPGGELPGNLGWHSAPEFTYTLTVDSTQLVTLDVGSFSGNLNVMVLKEMGGAYCDPTNGCFAFGTAPSGEAESVTFAAYPDVTYYVVVDGRQGTVSDFDISVTCDASGYEECGNTVDDDGDSLVDCDDPECFYVPPHCGSLP